MSATFYDKTCDAVCMRGAYEGACKADDFTNHFLQQVKTILQKYMLNDTLENVKNNDPIAYKKYMSDQSTIISYLCTSKIIYPVEMKKYLSENPAELINRFDSLTNNNGKKIIDELSKIVDDIYNQMIEASMIRRV